MRARLFSVALFMTIAGLAACAANGIGASQANCPEQHATHLTVLIYSGRPNPSTSIAPDTARRLGCAIASLKFEAAATSPPARLGFSGLVVGQLKIPAGTASPLTLTPREMFAQIDGVLYVAHDPDNSVAKLLMGELMDGALAPEVVLDIEEAIR